MIDCAVKTLAEQYELIGDPIDLSCFHKTDGENVVFNLLTKIHRPVFENNQRILVVQPDNDVYSYTENIASDSLIFLQKSLV